MSKNIKIIIGANFGDEGKGLATDYFSNTMGNNIVVCHNGGAQKGHTVTTNNGFRHVFHHFGSGLFSKNKSDTYLAKDFIVNPIIFRKEYEELLSKGIKPTVHVNRECWITTPFDMMINQILEEYRGESKHGSCGLGIYETIHRNMNFKQLIVSEYWFTENLKDILMNYFKKRLLELGIDKLDMKWLDAISNIGEVIERYKQDYYYMLDKVTLCYDNVLHDYDNIIFEGAQGLMLDKENYEYAPHLTPSNTGVFNPSRIISKLKYNSEDIEVVYVTRTYLTRHGAGKLKTECKKSDINKSMTDMTNVPNEFQGTLRYGTLDIDGLYKRIKEDISLNNYKTSLMVTHINEYDENLKDILGKFKGFDIYTSDGMTKDSIKLQNNA